MRRAGLLKYAARALTHAVDGTWLRRGEWYRTDARARWQCGHVASEFGPLVREMRRAQGVLFVGNPREMGEDVEPAKDSELSPELLLRTGHLTGTPSPLPVREGLVYQVSNHEVMGCPEHKFVFLKGLSLNSCND